jgi:GntR family transcriptional regulator
MRDLLRVNPADAAPIWRQIEEGLRRLLASRALAPGAALPSVRDLARDLRVNPATVAKAYQRLAEAGLLETRRGEGTFAVEAAPPVKAKERRLALLQGAERFAGQALAAGADLSEAQMALRRAWQELAGPAGTRDEEEA